MSTQDQINTIKSESEQSGSHQLDSLKTLKTGATSVVGSLNELFESNKTLDENTSQSLSDLDTKTDNTNDLLGDTIDRVTASEDKITQAESNIETAETNIGNLETESATQNDRLDDLESTNSEAPVIAQFSNRSTGVWDINATYKVAHFTLKTHDPSNSFSISNNEITVPIDGAYEIGVNLSVNCLNQVATDFHTIECIVELFDGNSWNEIDDSFSCALLYPNENRTTVSSSFFVDLLQSQMVRVSVRTAFYVQGIRQIDDYGSNITIKLLNEL